MFPNSDRKRLLLTHPQRGRLKPGGGTQHGTLRLQPLHGLAASPATALSHPAEYVRAPPAGTRRRPLADTDVFFVLVAWRGVEEVPWRSSSLCCPPRLSAHSPWRGPLPRDTLQLAFPSPNEALARATGQTDRQLSHLWVWADTAPPPFLLSLHRREFSPQRLWRKASRSQSQIPAPRLDGALDREGSVAGRSAALGRALGHGSDTHGGGEHPRGGHPL